MPMGAYGAVPYDLEWRGQIPESAGQCRSKSWFLIAERSVKADADRSI